MSQEEEEADLYYDAISTGPSTSNTEPVYWNDPPQSDASTTGESGVTSQQPPIEAQSDTNHTCKDETAGKADQNTLTTTDHTPSPHIGNAAISTQKSNKVLAKVARFEAAAKDTPPAGTSPIPTRGSPVPTRDSPVPNVFNENESERAKRSTNNNNHGLISKTDVSAGVANPDPPVDRDNGEAWEAWTLAHPGDWGQMGAANSDQVTVQHPDTGVQHTANDGASIKVVSDPPAKHADWGEWEAYDATYSTHADQNTESQPQPPNVANVTDPQDSGTAIYCLAKPFQDDKGAVSGPAVTMQQANPRPAGAGGRVTSVDRFGYSHARDTDNKPAGDSTATTTALTGTLAETSHTWTQQHGGVNVGTDNDSDDGEFRADFEQTIYDSVCSDSSVRTLDRSQVMDFEIVPDSAVGGEGSKDQQGTGSKGGSGHNWSRKQAKMRSRALKRSTKEHPFPSHHEFHDPHRGAVPELDEEGLLEPLSPFNVSDNNNSSSSSYFTDSDFDSPISDYSEGEDGEVDKQSSTISYNNKPLPPTPNKKKADSQLEEDGMVLERVKLRRPRDAPSLPDAPDGLTQVQMKMRGVLQSLVENERNYISSLQRIVDEYKAAIITQYITKNKEVKITFDRIEDILNIHKMFEIELADKLKNWYNDEKIGLIFVKFSSQMVIDSYSGYVNNFESTCEAIREVENSRQAFKEFMKNKQMLSSDRLSLSGLMLKPIQRFPQLIMIIKDLLKYTLRDHHDREPLQEALTGIENVAHQLNERKRRTEQYYLGQQIIGKLTPRVHIEKNSFLIRQDDMDQLSHDTFGYRLLMLNKYLVVLAKRKKRDQEGNSSDRYTYKWHQSLKELELTTSAITPHMHTRVHTETKSTAIFSPKQDAAKEEDPYSVASELTDMMHDVPILAQISQLVASLKLSYQGLTEDQIQEIVTKLQQEIQGKDYQLQMLNSSSIILQDKVRKKKYVFSAASANSKQEWCIDFLMAKYALDIVNIPSWHQHDMKGTNLNQPSLLTKHMSLDMQRTFTKIKCGVRVFFPTRTEGSVEHLWVCSSTEALGQVSIVSLHTAKPSLVESFQAAQSEIVCVESVPGFAIIADSLAFPEDSVWMSTVDSEILVFMFNEQKSDQHRTPIHRFHPGCVVISMMYVDDKVFCGSRGGMVLVYARNDDGVWCPPFQLQLGTGAVTSMVCVADSVWAACGSQIYIIDPETCKIQEQVDNQMDDPDLHVQFLVKAGVGVWASFHGRPNIVLFHSESKRLLQELSICNAINEFITVYTGEKQVSRNYEVTSLMASLGLLWAGTNVGVILTYPLPRLRDGVPRINQRPQVALHGHNGPIKFLIPVHYGPISANPIRRRPSSILGRSTPEKTGLIKMPKVEERSSVDSDKSEHLYVCLDSEAMTKGGEENIYEAVDYGLWERTGGKQGSKPGVTGGASPSKDKHKKARSELTQSGDQKYYKLWSETNEYVPVDSLPAGSRTSDEHKYFILEPGTQKFVPVYDLQGGVGSSETDSVPTEAAGEYTDMSLGAQGRTGEHVLTDTSVSVSTDADNSSGVVYRKNKASPNRPNSVDHVTDLPDNAGGVALRGKPSRHSVNPGKLFNQSIDSVDTLTRPVTIPGLPDLPVLPKSFRSELKNKLKMRKSQDNLTDLAVTKDGMGQLYGTLMRLSNDSNRDSVLSSSLPSNYALDISSSSESKFVRPRTTIAISTKKPDISATRFGSKKKQDSTKEDNKKTSIKHRMSAPPSPIHKQTSQSSFAGMGSVDTLRRQNSNTILMLSGGDGYKDWKKRQSLQNYRPEEPCLIFWMYKF